MFWEKLCENLGTIIGVIGSIAGVFLGWWLNNYSRKGKISIFVDESINGKFITQEEAYAGCLEDAKLFAYKFKVELYNSSSDTKVMRDIKLMFYGEKTELFEITPYDKALETSTYPIYTHRKIEILNIPAKSAITKVLYGWIDEKLLAKVMQTKMVFLFYKDEYNKEKGKIIEVKDYSQYDFDQMEDE